MADWRNGQKSRWHGSMIRRREKKRASTNAHQAINQCGANRYQIINATANIARPPCGIERASHGVCRQLTRAAMNQASRSLHRGGIHADNSRHSNKRALGSSAAAKRLVKIAANGRIVRWRR